MTNQYTGITGIRLSPWRRLSVAAVPGLAVLLSALLSACTGLPSDEPAANEPATEQIAVAAEQEESWSGIIMLDKPVGYEQRIRRPDGSGYRILRKAALRFRVLGVEKNIAQNTLDIIEADGRLRSFEHEYLLDGSRLRVDGTVANDRLTVHIHTSAGTDKQVYPLDEPLYSAAAVLLHPVQRQPVVGATYEHLIYDSETQNFERVYQTVLGQEIAENFNGTPAWSIETLIQGIRTVSLVTAAGIPLQEQSLNGMVSTRLEPKPAALAYLDRAGTDHEERLINHTLVPVAPIANARNSTHLELAIDGLNQWSLADINDGRQTCERSDDAVHCRILSTSAYHGKKPTDDDLRATTIITAGHPQIKKLADDITAGLTDDRKKISALVNWIDSHINDTAVDAFNAIDVLESRQGECQGQSFLYASLARTLNIPTRVVNGLVYSEPMSGFLYHTWAESWDGEGWHSVDPIFRQTPVDATHLRLANGASNRDITPLLNLIGRIRMRVIGGENDGDNSGQSH